MSLWPSPHQVSGVSQHWGLPCLVKVSARLLLLQARSFLARMESNSVTAALIHHRFPRYGGRNTLQLCSSTRGLTAHIRSSQITLISRSFGVYLLKLGTFPRLKKEKEKQTPFHQTPNSAPLKWEQTSVSGYLVCCPQTSLTKCRLELFYHSLFSCAFSPGDALCTGAYTE